MSTRKGRIISFLTIVAISIGLIGGIIGMQYKELNKASAAAKTIGNYSFYEMSEEAQIYTYEKGNNEITITGLTPYGNTLSQLIIPDTIEDLPVTKIGMFAIEQKENLKSVVLGRNVNELLDYAFNFNKKLSTVVLNEGLLTIGSGAFASCDKITQLELPSTLITIGVGALQLCTSIQDIIIPSNVTRVLYRAFEHWNNSQTIKIVASSKPSGWASNWNAGCNAQIIWGYTGN